jgi:hypothetical protein
MKVTPYIPLIHHSILQLYYILISRVQVTINLLIVVIVVIRKVKSSLRAFVILAIIIVIAINTNAILFLSLYICEVLTNLSL